MVSGHFKYNLVLPKHWLSIYFIVKWLFENGMILPGVIVTLPTTIRRGYPVLCFPKGSVRKKIITGVSLFYVSSMHK